MENHTITILTFYQFKGFVPKYVAISWMGISKFWFPKGKAVRINKLLGTGSGIGFSRMPNFGQYVHFGIWDSIHDYKEYCEHSVLLKKLGEFASNVQKIELTPHQSRGIWDGVNPYPMIPANAERGGKVVVLTRAKVKLKNLLHFWRLVSPTNTRLEKSKGRIFSAGLGEWPFSHPITFSIWESLDAAKDFAYGHNEHALASQKAKKRQWFKEDLFVRFSLEHGEISN